MSEGISEEVLLESELVNVKLRRYIRTRKQGTRIFEVEFEGKVYKIGTIGEEAFKALLRHGRKEGGEIYFKIPRWTLKEGEIWWITVHILGYLGWC